MTSPGQPAAGEQLPAQDSFVRRVATVVTITAIAALLLPLFILGLDILLAAFAGVLFAVMLRALTDLVKRVTPLPDIWAYATVLVALVAIIGGGGWLLAPQIATQADQLTAQLPGVAREIEQFLQQYRWGQWILEQAQDNDMGGGASQHIGGFFGVLSELSTYILTALFVGLFAAANPRFYTESIVYIFPLRHRSRIRALLNDIGFALRWWIIGQAAAMVLIGVSTMILLWAFGIPLAIVVGLIVGLLGFIPYLGPILGAIPVAIIAATEGTTQLLYVLLAYMGVQLLEGYVATPLIQQRMVHLPPAFTIVAQVLLGAVMGLIGFILATPLAAVVLVLTRFYRMDILGDPEAQAMEEEAENSS
jgi:predicted PurR-regulated permease PerM